MIIQKLVPIKILENEIHVPAINLLKFLNKPGNNNLETIFIAMDDDGDIFAYDAKPSINTSVWLCKVGHENAHEFIHRVRVKWEKPRECQEAIQEISVRELRQLLA